jgi:dsRNA-specific ribonuclease
MESLNRNLNQQSTVTLASLQHLNLKDVFISLLNEPIKIIKTPISLLQEIMTKCSLPPPVYEEVSAEGHSYMTIFCFRVVIHMSNNEIIAVAKGHSKKKAKHAAAFEVIIQLRNQYLPVDKSLSAKFDNLL